MADETHPLETQIATLQLKPGDILVIRYEEKLSDHSQSYIKKQVEQILERVGVERDKIGVMILDSGAEVSKLTTREGAEERSAKEDAKR